LISTEKNFSSKLIGEPGMDVSDFENLNFDVEKLAHDSDQNYYISFEGATIKVFQEVCKEGPVLWILFRDALEFISMIFPKYSEHLILPTGIKIRNAPKIVLDLQTFLRTRNLWQEGSQRNKSVEVHSLKYFVDLKWFDDVCIML
jgi:hypothetical protein